MQHGVVLDVFHTLAEVSVAVTGFSSLIIIFRRRSSDWNRQDFVSLAFVLCWSTGSIFLSLLPILLVEFGFDLAIASEVGLLAAFAYIAIAGGLLTKVQLSVSRVGGGNVNKRIRVVMTMAFLAIAASAMLGALGLLSGPPHAWYAAVIAMLLVSATANLGVFVVQATRSNGEG